MSTSDGSTADYYELPAGATELQDLISHRNLNAQDGEIFRAIYRKGRASHSDELRDAKKVLFYAQAEVARLERLKAGSALSEEFCQVNTLNTLASNEINSSAKLTPTIKQSLTVAGEVPPLWATHLLENKNKGRAWAKFQHGNYISKLGRVYNLHRWSVVKQLFTTDKLSGGKFKSGGFTGKGCAVMSASAGLMLRCHDCIAEHCPCVAK